MILQLLGTFLCGGDPQRQQQIKGPQTTTTPLAAIGSSKAQDPGSPNSRNYFNESDKIVYKSHRLRVKDVPGDGNCFFHAVKKQLGENSQSTHSDLRKAAVAYGKGHEN